MAQQIIPISLPLPLNISNVNCYLLKTDTGFFIIDTGMTNARRQLDAMLDRLGCHPGDLKLVLITHGDFDHTGNAVFLRQKYGSQIAMHTEDVGMLENGDIFWHRKIDNRVIRGLMKAFMPLKEENRGKPDIFLEDEASLSSYGLEATVYNTPGHSSGSICVLTTSGELFCGDLLTSSKGKPMLNSMMYDKEAGISSVERLKALKIQTVYPGHGEPFPWEALL
jgi:hydroxyacylglutathione hydrolase